MAKQKSILDGVPIDDKAFPLIGEKNAEDNETIGIVSKCSLCGSPIYGPSYIRSNKEPVVRRTCNCQEKPKNFQDSTCTK
jgi:hypothetical protein